MNNLSYWEKRKAELMFSYMEKAEEASDQISAIYLKASRYLSLEMEGIFEKFQSRHKLSEKEAYRLLHTMPDRTSMDDLLQALKNNNLDKSKDEIITLLESPAYQARIERLQQLKNQLDITMQQVYNKEKVQNTNHYMELANEAYYKSIFDIQQQTGLGFSFNWTTPKTIDRVINSKWSGANYSQRIWNNTQTLAQALKEEMLISLITGRSERETAEIIADKFAQGASNARRLVRTESCNLANQMEMESYKECGIEYYLFVATLDLKTSSICQKMDGRRFRVEEQQPGKNCPPMHPWCRSTTICDITEGELKGLTRRARNPDTGKTELVSGDMTYAQWYKSKVLGHPAAELNEKMIKNRSSDRNQYEKYKQVLGDESPKTLDSFQKMKYTKAEKWQSQKALYRKMNAYNRIIEKEPEITKDLLDISENIGVEMAGLEYRVKTKESYLRKINKDSKNSLETEKIKEVISNTNDIIRYTYQSEPHSLVESYKKITEQLELNDYHAVRIKNTWLDKWNPYKGVNCIFKSPAGQNFEIQFHTPESLKAKEQMHKLYEQQRIEPEGSEKSRELNRKMFEISKSLEYPERIEEVK